ncbi:MAG: lysylphosphatidylglycerol synthase transmembrane domain-containing protein [Anaerolineales bacterium]
MSQARLKQSGLFILSLIISLGALYVLIRGDIDVLQDEIADGRYGYTVPTVILFVLGLIARGYRWRVLLGYKTTTWHAFHIMNVGYMLNNLPLRVGELARAWMTTRLTPPIAFFTSISSIVVERLLDLAAVVVLLSISLILLDVPQFWTGVGVAVGAITIIGFSMLIYFAHHRELPHRILSWAMRRMRPLQRLNLVEWLDHFLDGLEPLTNARLRTEAIAWTIIAWALSVISGYVLMLVFFEEGNWGAIMLTIVMLALAIAIPAMPGNLGTFEAAGVAGLWLAGVIEAISAPENAPALAFAVLLHAITIAGYILLGMVGLWSEQLSVSQLRAGVQSTTDDTIAPAAPT